MFAEGAQALHHGDLATADRDFKTVLQLDPSSAAAYTNLGVISMRQRHWTDALAQFHKAETLDPSLSGVQLDVGLVYYRMNDFPAAAEAFDSLLKDQPASIQARYLFGLSSFFADRYAAAEKALLPLWPNYSASLSYLYVLGSAAHKAGDEVEETRAFRQMEAVGQGTAEFHLYAGKAALTKQDSATAEQELDAAIVADPKLPMAHFFRAETMVSQNKLEAARSDLVAEIALEPDVAFSYDELGRVEQRLQHPELAAQAFQQALAHDPSLGTAYVGLAQIARDGHQYDQALKLLDHAVQLQPASASTHYLRGQVLARLHRQAEAKAEFARASDLLKAVGDRMKSGTADNHAADAQFTQGAAQE